MMSSFYGSGPRRGFVTRWTVAGDAAARTITPPLVNTNGSAFNCTIYWGDGTSSTVTSYDDANRIHTYASNGTYDVEIMGVCEGWSFNNTGSKLRCVAILNWGNVGAFSGFKYLAGGFWGCSNNISVGTGKILPAGAGPTDISYLLSNSGCTFITSGLLDNLTAVTDASYCFVANPVLASLPPGLLDRLTSVTTLRAFAYICSELAAVPARFMRNLTSLTNLSYGFSLCPKLQLSADMFYDDGEQATRFLDKAMDFTKCFERTTFTGAQGTAPDLWNCDYGETITLDVAPASDWSGGDVITGQSSGATATVVTKVSSLVYKIKKHFGTFTLGEIVGVTGTPAKLADQGAGNPTFTGTPVSLNCFGGAGNSIASISNYADIPASWK